MAFDEEKALPDQAYLRFASRAANVAGIKQGHFERSSGTRPLTWALFFAPRLEQALGMAAWPTCGTVLQRWSDGVSSVFGDGDDTEAIERLFDSAQARELGRDWQAKHHAWVTLESGHIIDVSLMTRLALGWPERHPGWIGGLHVGDADVLAVSTGAVHVPRFAGVHAFEQLDRTSPGGIKVRLASQLLSCADHGREAGP